MGKQTSIFHSVKHKCSAWWLNGEERVVHGISELLVLLGGYIQKVVGECHTKHENLQLISILLTLDEWILIIKEIVNIFSVNLNAWV